VFYSESVRLHFAKLCAFYREQLTRIGSHPWPNLNLVNAFREMQVGTPQVHRETIHPFLSDHFHLLSGLAQTAFGATVPHFPGWWPKYVGIEFLSVVYSLLIDLLNSEVFLTRQFVACSNKPSDPSRFLTWGKFLRSVNTLAFLWIFPAQRPPIRTGEHRHCPFFVESKTEQPFLHIYCPEYFPKPSFSVRDAINFFYKIIITKKKILKT